MSEKPCQKEYDDFVEAGMEHDRIQQAISGILPLGKELSATVDLVPVVLTEEMMTRWRELKKQVGPAHDDWIQKAQVYQDCRKRHMR